MLVVSHPPTVHHCEKLGSLICQDSKVLSHRAVLHLAGPQPVPWPGCLPSQLQGCAFALAELALRLQAHPSSLLMSLWRSPALRHVDSFPLQLGVICKLGRSTPHHLLQVINNHVQQDRAQGSPLRHPTWHQPLGRVQPINNYSPSLTSQSFLPICSSTCWDHNILTWAQEHRRNGVESLAELEINHFCYSPLTHKPGHFIKGGDQVVQAWFTLGKCTLTVASHLLLLHVPRNVFQEDPLQGPNEPDQPVVPRINLLVFFEEECSICLSPGMGDLLWSVLLYPASPLLQPASQTQVTLQLNCLLPDQSYTSFSLTCRSSYMWLLSSPLLCSHCS